MSGLAVVVGRCAVHGMEGGYIYRRLSLDVWLALLVMSLDHHATMLSSDYPSFGLVLMIVTGLQPSWADLETGQFSPYFEVGGAWGSYGFYFCWWLYTGTKHKCTAA